MAALTGAAALASDKPNFTGTWELTSIDGKLPNGVKETQMWVHQEPKLNIKIMTMSPPLGYPVELTYTTGGQAGTVGYRTGPEGAREIVTGSAHWDGNRLVCEQNMPNARTGAPRRIVRTLTLEGNGSKMVARQVFWMAGEDEPREATWHWERKSVTP